MGMTGQITLSQTIAFDVGQQSRMVILLQGPVLPSTAWRGVVTPDCGEDKATKGRQEEHGGERACGRNCRKLWAGMEAVHTSKMFQAWDCLACHHLEKKELMTEHRTWALVFSNLAPIIKDPEAEVGAQPQN